MKSIKVACNGIACSCLLSLAAATLFLGGCASRPYFDAPPLMPEPLEPVVDTVLVNGAPVRFVWRETPNTEFYEFHIFDRTNSDITRYAQAQLKPSSVCGGGICSLTTILSMPIDAGHAWRVRATNNAGFSSWSRSIFAVAN